MGRDYLYEYAENALKEALTTVTNNISGGYKTSATKPLFQIANQIQHYLICTVHLCAGMQV